MCARSRVLKRCKMCHKMKSLSDYYVSRLQGDKHEPVCKSCNDKNKS